MLLLAVCLVTYMNEGKTISTKQKDSSKAHHLVAVLFF